MPPDVTRRPPGPQPDDRLADQITADAPAERRTTVCIVADIVLEAADLIAGRGELDQRAYERGRLDGFADGWRCGLKAAARRYLRQSDNWIREKRSRVRSDPTGTPQTRSSPGSEDPGSPPQDKALRKATAPSPRKEADAAMLMLKHSSDVRVEALAPGACRCCGHDLVAALRRLVAERQEAWQDGLLEGFGEGWDQRGEAERERGAA
jgi:hypothetical protein